MCKYILYAVKFAARIVVCIVCISRVILFREVRFYIDNK